MAEAEPGEDEAWTSWCQRVRCISDDLSTSINCLVSGDKEHSRRFPFCGPLDASSKVHLVAPS